MKKEQILLQAQRIVDARRQVAESRKEKLLEQLRQRQDWKNCEQTLKSAQVRYVLYNDANAKDTVEQMKTQQSALLHKYGLSEQDLTVKYSCVKCNDSGYIGNTMCSCLKQEFRRLLSLESNVPNADWTFDNSEESLKHNVAVYNKAKEVCNTSGNILLTGGTGTGKTYLLCACANLCTLLCKSVLFVTAYNLSATFLKAHLSNLETKQAILSDFTDIDVLCIDDLGTENVYKNVTAEYLFAVVNERIAQAKQTFCTTNLSLSALRERYDERLFSRLVDQKTTFIAALNGKDKRLQK